jgi:hypothetical protein
MSEPRPARIDEVPKFGSLWSYNRSSKPTFMAISVEGHLLHCLRLEDAHVDHLFWSSAGGVFNPETVRRPDGGWWCHDE